ncbi:MAG: caspase family protein [Planctomycetes bacterium]|nr:caspase family protein [Planctomycetota bacterium]
MTPGLSILRFVGIVSILVLGAETSARAYEELTLGEVREGTLDDEDRGLAGGGYADEDWHFWSQDNQNVAVVLESSLFEPVLKVFFGREQLTFGATEGMKVVAEIDMTRNRLYDFEIGSALPGGKGRYTILVKKIDARANPGGAAQPRPAPAPEAGPAQPAPAPGATSGNRDFSQFDAIDRRNISTFRGSLADADQQIDPNRFADIYAYQVAEGAILKVTLTASSFDAFLYVQTPSGEIVENDNSGDLETDSSIELEAKRGGKYLIVATSTGQKNTGAYVLRIRAMQESDTIVTNPQNQSSVPAQTQPERPPSGFRGRTTPFGTTGSLQRGDQTYRSGDREGAFYDSYEIWFPQGSFIEVKLESRSRQYDPFLIVEGPANFHKENDDVNYPSDTNSAVTFFCSNSGSYTVYATSYASGAAGNYSLSVTSEFVSASETMVRTLGRRYFGIFVGIRDYPDDLDDLEYCDEDATLLSRAFTGGQLMGAESFVVLTNSGATTRAVRDAFTTIKRQIGPRDAFVFFFSGHGQQSEYDESNTDEVDRKQESIVLHDGELLDDELATLVGELNCAIRLVAIDACFSGGFARDVVNKPGTIGIFSSEEDLTSNVASEFSAGGYLSLFFREAVSERADVNRNGTIDVGELCHYIQNSYGSRVRESEVETNDGEIGYQHVVVDRGSVTVGTELFRTR